MAKKPFAERMARLMLKVMAVPVVLGVLFYLAMARNSAFQPTYKERSGTGALWRTHGVTVAVVWPAHQELGFVEGVQLALEDIDADRTHPLRGKIRVKKYTEDGSGRSGAAISHKVAGDASVVAVLGHEVSESAVPASLTYENHGILFLTTKSTDPRLCDHGFLYTFCMTPDDRAIARDMAAFAARRKWTKIGVYSERSTGGESMSEELISALEANGVEPTYERSYLPSTEAWDDMDFRPLIASTESDAVDALMVVDELPRGARLISDLRKMRTHYPAWDITQTLDDTIRQIVEAWQKRDTLKAAEVDVPLVSAAARPLAATMA